MVSQKCYAKHAVNVVSIRKEKIMLQDVNNKELDKRKDIEEVKIPTVKDDTTIGGLIHNIKNCSFDYMDYKLSKKEADFIINRETAIDLDNNGMEYKCPCCGAEVNDEFTCMVSDEIRYCYHCGQRVLLGVVSL
jgi:DNA-directed RNA polymerase subunit RPC12/RpoP